MPATSQIQSIPGGDPEIEFNSYYSLVFLAFISLVQATAVET